MDGTELFFTFPFKISVTYLVIIALVITVTPVFYITEEIVSSLKFLSPFCIFLRDTGTAQLPMQLPLK